MLHARVLAGLFALSLAAAAGAAPADGAPELTPVEQLRILEQLRPALVQVEVTLRYDQGEPPIAGGWGDRCPNCGQYHGIGGGEEYIRQQRPLEFGGLLLAADRVLTYDPQIHPRFVERIAVRAGDQVHSATIVAYARHESGIVLQLAEPLAGAAPLVFDATRPAPYFAVDYQPRNGTWQTTIKPLAVTLTVSEPGLPFRGVASGALLVDAAGQPVGVSLTGELPVDDAWRGSPADWPLISAAEMAAQVERVRAAAGPGLPHVTLHFRSAKKPSEQMRYSMREAEDATELQTAGIVLAPRTLLVLSLLKPAQTARLERIQVRLADGSRVPATFRHTLREHGGFIAELEQPLTPLPVFAGDIRDLRRELLVGAEVIPYGEHMTMRFMPSRVAGFEFAYKRRVYPQLVRRTENLFLFTVAGELVTAPLAIRQPTGPEDRWSSTTESAPTPLAPLVGLLGDLAAASDPSNVPLSEDEENRVAWLGVELQSLDADLARAKGVSDLTQNGQTGAIVSYVYSDSPAAQQGVQPGWILLRLHPAQQPQPVAVQADDDQFMGEFPWDRFDELPEEYYDRVPQPWPSADNTLARALTELGFGQGFKAEFFHDGQSDLREFTVVQSPPYYDTAPRFKSESLGLTVRDMTYEVRRYFQHTADEPGVIVAKVEQGSRASVAGLKPYEIITQVNGEAVPDAAAFKRLAASTTEELRLNVKRMTRARIVKIVPAPPTTQPGGSPAETDAPPRSTAANPDGAGA